MGKILRFLRFKKLLHKQNGYDVVPSPMVHRCIMRGSSKTYQVLPEVLPGLDKNNMTPEPSIEPPSYNEAVFQNADSAVQNRNSL